MAAQESAPDALDAGRARQASRRSVPRSSARPREPIGEEPYDFTRRQIRRRYRPGNPNLDPSG